MKTLTTDQLLRAASRGKLKNWLLVRKHKGVKTVGGLKDIFCETPTGRAPVVVFAILPNKERQSVSELRPEFLEQQIVNDDYPLKISYKKQFLGEEVASIKVKSPMLGVLVLTPPR